jgi:Ni/Fe-hydrogenase subunit HybB-like protein
MVTPTKLHPLWHTYWLPGLFLISCWTMGFGSVVLIENVTTWIWPRRTDQKMLSKLAVVAMWLLVAWTAIRLADLVVTGNLSRALAAPRAAFFFSWFALELAVTAAAIAILATKKLRANPGYVFGASCLMVFQGALYRFDTYLTGYLPARAGATYFPSFWEITNSIGWAAIGVAVYVVMVKRFPMLSGVVVKKPAKKGLVAVGQ